MGENSPLDQLKNICVDWFDGVGSFQNGVYGNGQKGVLKMMRVWSPDYGTYFTGDLPSSMSVLAVGMRWDKPIMGLKQYASNNWSIFGSSSTYTIYKPFGDTYIGPASAGVDTVSPTYSSYYYGYLNTFWSRVFVFDVNAVTADEIMAIDPLELLA